LEFAPSIIIWDCAPPVEAPEAPVKPRFRDRLGKARTLLGDAGVCLKSVPVCTSEGACSGERLVCGGSIVSELAPTGLTIPLAGFPCLPGNCLRDSCPPDKYCLGDGFEYERSIANLCVPKCVDGKCPPDFSCQQHLDDWICIPGVPGARCTSDEGCLLGSCVDTGVEFVPAEFNLALWEVVDNFAHGARVVVNAPEYVRQGGNV